MTVIAYVSIILPVIHAIFGIVQSPFLLNGGIKEHLEPMKEAFQEQKRQQQEIENFYVNEIITGGCTVEEVSQRKTISQHFKMLGCNFTNGIQTEYNLKMYQL